MKLVVTIVGKDRVGIIAMVSQVLAENNINVVSVNQTILDGFFNMVMLAESSSDTRVNLVEIQKILKEKGEEMGLQIKAQHQDIFNVMHNV